MATHRKLADGTIRHDADVNRKKFLPAHVLAEMALPGWDERGWHGGGMQTVRSTQRRNPKRGNTRNGKAAHRMPYGPGRTW